MTIVPISKARGDLATIMNKVVYGGERIVIDRHGKDKVAVVSIEDAEFLEAMETKRDLATIRRRMKEPREPWNKIKAELGL
jgi:prevent-host-death family protein